MPRLGEILVREGACTQEAIRSALQSQVIFGGRLGTNLLEVQAVSEEALSRALGRQHGLPSLCGDMRLDPQATGLLTPDVADRYDAIPYVLADRRLALLVVDPKNLAMLDEVAFATGKLVHPIVVPEARVWALLRRTYGLDRHLRGIEVDFRNRPGAPRAPDPAAPGPAARGDDLMDEGAFDAIYGSVGAVPVPPPARAAPPPAPPPPPPEDDVVELTDLLLEPEPPAAAPPDAVTAGRGAASPPASPLARDPYSQRSRAHPSGPPGEPGQPRAAAPALAPEVVAALSGAAGHAPPQRIVRPAPRREEPEPSALGFQEAVRFLEGVDERNAIAKTVLRYARSRFRRAVLFTVHRGAAHGWAGLGEKLSAASVARMHLALGAPGIVDTVVKTQAHFLGPIPKTEANIRLLKALGGGVPANAFVVPILALGRVVNVFYGDDGKGGVVDAANVGELLILATRIAKSYDALLERVR